jgi:tetratricopeptide (TPR) repeat protein
MGGMGKSQLAWELAHRLADRFPDGRIFIDMQGTGERPLTAEDAMARVIEAFSPEAKPPAEPERLKAAYRATLTGKRALLLLDNAADTRQVAPLLPPAPVALLVTSRRRILLQGTKSLELRTLTPGSALALLRGLVSTERADDAALATIAKHCGYLPLALRAASSFLHVHPSWTVADYLEALAGERTRLVALAVPEVEIDISSVLGLSLGKLSDEHREIAAAWTLLAVFPAGFDRGAAAAVWQQDLTVTRERLDDLVGRSLLTAEGEARFRLHDLLRDLARERADIKDLRAAHLRHARHYLGVLWKVDAMYKSADTSLAGLALFDSERANIEAAQRWATMHLSPGPDVAVLCFEFTNAGAYVLMLRQPPRVRIRWLEAAVEGCRLVGDRRRMGAALGNLGLAWFALGEARKAIGLHEEHLAIARDTADRESERNALNNLGVAWFALGEARKAIDYHKQHLAIARETADRRGEGAALGNLGLAWGVLREPRKAIGLHEQHLAIAREIGDRQSEGTALGNLGNARADLGEPRKAIGLHEQHLAIAREIGDRQSEGTALGNLGLAWAVLGEPRKAIELYEQHLAITREIGDRRGEGNALWNAAIAHETEGDETEAVRRATLALAVRREIEDPHGPKIEAWLRQRGIEP